MDEAEECNCVAMTTEKLHPLMYGELDGGIGLQQNEFWYTKRKFATDHTEVQILFDPLLSVLELIMQTHYVQGVQGVHDRRPQLGIT